MLMGWLARSSGSACKTGDPEPSDVLLALGPPAMGIRLIARNAWKRITEEHIVELSRTLAGTGRTKQKAVCGQPVRKFPIVPLEISRTNGTN
jgi:cysteine sulfinate desulfinase/cysteine desulfurase-like protein